jgi:hypothetical protein
MVLIVMGITTEFWHNVHPILAWEYPFKTGSSRNPLMNEGVMLGKKRFQIISSGGTTSVICL